MPIYPHAPLHTYLDGRSVVTRGFVLRISDHGGTDITYAMRNLSGGYDSIPGHRLQGVKLGWWLDEQREGE